MIFFSSEVSFFSAFFDTFSSMLTMFRCSKTIVFGYAELTTAFVLVFVCEKNVNNLSF